VRRVTGEDIVYLLASPLALDMRPVGAEHGAGGAA
jgi:hypothetical protein